MPSHRPSPGDHADKAGPLHVAFLGSGSSGNATAVTDGATTVLVDCGFSAREVFRRCALEGIDAATVSAVLLTHEHTDHTRGVRVFAKRTGAAVWATRGTRREASLDEAAADVRTLTAGSPQRIGTLQVLPFRTSHDAADPVGFRIESGGVALGLVTDTGVLTPEAAEALRAVDLLAIESNHDLGMLERGPYPYHLKRRIASATGHLSNHDAGAVVESVASDRLKRVFAMHLSRTNNTLALASGALTLALARLSHPATVQAVAHDATCSTSDSSHARSHDR